MREIGPAVENPVVDFNEWLGGQAEQQKKIVVLEEALLGNKFWAYAFFRLRFFLLKLATESAIHAVRALLLFTIFFQRGLLDLLLLYAVAEVFSSFWWGSLEVMRERIRHLYRSQKRHLISSEIGRWLSLASLLAAATAFVGFVVVMLAMRSWTFSPATLYIAAIFLRLSLGFLTRCYHSGIYSLRRIYRPLPTIVAVEASSFIAILSLWPWLGVWSFPIAEIAATLLVTAMSLYYTGRAYQLAGFEPLGFLNMKRWPAGFARNLREWVMGGLSNVIMSMHSLMIVVLLASSPSTESGELSLFTMFFIISPLVRAGCDWARLFYFDLKRLDLSLLAGLRRRFERRVSLLAWFVAVILWMFASLASTLVYQESVGVLYLLLLPFFLSRSVLALHQIRAFSDKSYGDLLWSGAVFFAGTAAAGFLLDTGGAKLIAVSALALGAVGVLALRQPGGKNGSDGGLFWPVEWLSRICSEQVPIKISFAQLAAKEEVKVGRPKHREVRMSHRQLAERLAARLGEAGRVTVLPRGRIVWYRRGDNGAGVDVESGWLLQKGAGLVNYIDSTGVHGNGRSALVAAREQGALHALLGHAGTFGGNVVEVEEVREAFTQTFPAGVIYDLDRPIPPQLEALSSKDKRSILNSAVAFSRDFGRARMGSRFEVSAFCLSGELRLIFLVDRNVDTALRARWHEQIKRFNLEAAMAFKP